MKEFLITQRVIDANDWATVLFVLCLALIAIARTVFEKRFADFSRLLVSDKYINVYKDSGHVVSGFTTLLFLVQLISFAFFIQIALDHFDHGSKTDWILFVRIFTLLSVFILSKFLVDKIIAAAFKIDEVAEQYNLRKVSYRTYLGLILLPINIILFYSNNISDLFIFILICAVLIINLLTYLLSLRNYQKFIGGKLFYFILYLCALEIAPYYFMYYWFTKN